MRDKNITGETCKARHAPPDGSGIFATFTPRAQAKKYSTAGALANGTKANL
jgi:hypothetical protein